jgi:hypothetical protein
LLEPAGNQQATKDRQHRFVTMASKTRKSQQATESINQGGDNEQSLRHNFCQLNASYLKDGFVQADVSAL